MSLPEPKPFTNLTKKGYRQVCDYIIKNTDDAEFVIDFMTEAFRNTIGFDPDAKVSPEVSKRQAEQRKQKLAKEGVSAYEKYNKPRYERLKEQFPGLSPYTIMRHSTEELEKLATV